jgi:putative Ca2+/H+ antiporter (TMEM165/GDT1 family)
MNATGIPPPPPSLVEEPFAQATGPSAGKWASYQSHGFVAALLVILTSELGDKTFLMTAMKAMKYNRQSVFLGAVSAAILMISLSVLMGMATTFIPTSLTHLISTALLAYYGVQMLREGFSMSPHDEGKDETQLETMGEDDADLDKASKWRKVLAKYFSVGFIQIFTVNLFAEWGDKSQVATVILAARENAMLGVLLGAIAGHVICNALAVVGGRFIANLISERTVTLCGGFMFIAFAVYPIIFGT